jgi:hypothetical protein
MEDDMTARMLVRVCSILEVATGVALIANPDFVVRALFGVGLSGDVAIARRAGIGPLLLGLMCWPRGDDIPTPVIWAQLTYNLLVALYLGYLRIDDKFVSNAL